jgi:glycerol uptake facilitator protein
MSQFWGELLGTMFLIILGDGVVAEVLLNKSKGQNTGWMVITSGWAFAVMVGVFIAQFFGSAPAYINPAVSLGFAIRTGDFSTFLSDFGAEMIGAFVGAIIVFLIYLPHWPITEDKDAKLSVFSTMPAVRNYAANFITETLATMVLVIGVAAIFKGNVSPALGPFLVGALVWGIGLSLGGPTGYAINPARDLGPRIAHAILPIPGKRNSDWAYAWVPVLGPLFGGALAGLILNLMHL